MLFALGRGGGTCQSRACWLPASLENESTLKQGAEKQLSAPEKVIPESERLRSAQWRDAINYYTVLHGHVFPTLFISHLHCINPQADSSGRVALSFPLPTVTNPMEQNRRLVFCSTVF